METKKKILVYKGKSEYNVLRYATDKICEGFHNCGYETDIIDVYDDEDGRGFLNCLERRDEYAFYFSFQALLWNMEMMGIPQLKEIKKVGWIVDAPVYHSARLLLCSGIGAHVLTIQHSHADIVRCEYPQFKNVETLYHGGFEEVNELSYNEKDIDIFFSGTYVPLEEAEKAVDEIDGVFGKLAQIVKQRLKVSEMSDTWVNVLKNLLDELNFEISDNEYRAMIEEMYPLDQYQRSYMRHRMVECIVSQGLTLSVVGNGWDKYNGAGKEHLKILSNSGMDISEVVKMMQRSKIVLNNINFVDGMHERIFTAMLAKAVCLTNANSILDDLFEDGKDLITYSISEPEKIPEIIRKLLENLEEAEKIAESGYRKTKEKHTWQHRGEQIIKWMEDGEKFIY